MTLVSLSRSAVACSSDNRHDCQARLKDRMGVERDSTQVFGFVLADGGFGLLPVPISKIDCGSRHLAKLGGMKGGFVRRFFWQDVQNCTPTRPLQALFFVFKDRYGH